ncbi:putative MFS family arabinose efflux permease [Microbacterium terrae]|nr:putative MFS family arabinose efflux permease [Microbacterium terrae]GLJ97217.1 hypothetical protein GCM10017594_04140 [Microbacterium terrae]
MISVFAFTVVLTTAPLSLAFAKAPRKPLVIASLAIVSLGNLGVALAPGLEWIMGARVVGAMAHGLFWAVVATYAVEIVPREKLGRATAYTAVGGSLAGILGIPIGNMLGEWFGWRIAFAVVALAGVATAAVLVRWLPAIGTKTSGANVTSTKSSWDRSAIGIAAVCFLILVLVLGQTAFGPYTTLWLEDVAGFERSMIPLYLMITGVAGAVGAVVAGNLYDRYPRATFALSGTVLTLSMVLLPVVASTGFSGALLAVAICSSMGFAGLPMMLQTRMMHTASPQLRRLAGAVQTTVFNVAIGGGAVIGGLVVVGPGVAVLPLLAAAAAVVTCLAAVLWDSLEAAASRRLASSSMV